MNKVYEINFKIFVDCLLYQKEVIRLRVFIGTRASGGRHRWFLFSAEVSSELEKKDCISRFQELDKQYKVYQELWRSGYGEREKAILPEEIKVQFDAVKNQNRTRGDCGIGGIDPKKISDFVHKMTGYYLTPFNPDCMVGDILLYYKDKIDTHRW